MKVFYHSGDLDGKCAGAIVKKRFPEAVLIGIDYGEDFPWGEVDDKTFMVDFSLSPKEMKSLNNMTLLYFIDHHKSTIDRVEAMSAPSVIKGLRSDKVAACELTWQYLFSGEKVPYAVKLLSLYDCWDHRDFMVLPFQYGVRLMETDPNNQTVWGKLFGLKKEDSLVDKLCENGKLILNYLKKNNVLVCEKAAFEMEFHGLACLALNSFTANSKVFDSVEEGKYDMFIIFRFVKDKWVVSLFSEKMDVSQIAIKHNGGGHPGASGFVCDKLPFKLPVNI